MAIAAAVVSGVLALLLVASASMKLTHRRAVVEGYRKVGVPEDRLNHLAMILLAGAAGLVAGIIWAPIGIAAAIGLVVYFALAVGAHVRFHDTVRLPTPILYGGLAVAALLLRLAAS